MEIPSYIGQMIVAPHKRETDIEKLAAIFMNDCSERNFNRLINRIKWGLRSYIYTIVQDTDAVDDIMSRTMEQIYFKRDMFDNEIAKFSTWIYKIAYNNSIKYLQNINIYGSKIDCVDQDISDMNEKNVFENTDSDINCDGFCGYTEDNDFDMLFNGTECVVYTKDKIFSDMYDASVECMKYLPDNCRLVMTERYIEKKKVKEIAVSNNLSVTDVKNWLVSARKLLNAEIKERYSDLYDLYTKSNVN